MDGERTYREQLNHSPDGSAPSPSDGAGAPTWERGTLTRDSRDVRRALGLFREGTGTVEVKKRWMLKAIDETWVTMIEDTIPSIDVIIRHPGKLLEENEELRAVEQVRRVTPRSVQHLSQHTDLINEIRPDGSVIPSKLLNVYQDETVLTYENRFLNTLINRLYAFVCLRVDAAEECGTDEKLSSLSFEQPFADGDVHGKVSLRIELSEKPNENEIVKNYVYSGDLWKRVLRVKSLVTSYMTSPFSQMMGKNFVRPPVMRTNLLLKNVDFRRCLALWEFLESYENLGYETLVKEETETISDARVRAYYETFAEQYLLFEGHLGTRVGDTAPHDLSDGETIPYRVRTEPDPLSPRDFTYTDKLPDLCPDDREAPGEMQDRIDYAVRVAIAADRILAERERERKKHEEEPRFRYRYSFLARLILAGDPVQDHYTEIKNYLLSHEKVKSRVSWEHESYSVGRKKCARLNVKGKTLFVYLPLTVGEVDEKYRLTAVSGTIAEQGFPSLLRVKTARGVKNALALIDRVMAGLGIGKPSRLRSDDYHLPLATREEMAMRVPPLVKILGGDPTGEENAPTPATAPDTVIEPSVSPVENIAVAEPSGAPTVDEDAGEVCAEGETTFRYRYSFLARLIQAEPSLQAFYGEIKNHLLSFATVRAGMAFGYERFHTGRRTLVKMKMRGKALYLYCALSPANYVGKKYGVKDLSDGGKTPELPLLMKVKSARGVKYAKEIVSDLMRAYGLQKTETPSVDYTRPYQTTEELANLPEPLVKIIPVARGTDYFATLNAQGHPTEDGGEDDDA